MIQPLHILLLEDDPDHAALIQRLIRSAAGTKLTVEHAARFDDAIHRLGARPFDAVLSDMHLPDSDLSQSLPLLVSAAGEAPVVVLTSLEDHQIAVDAVHRGAQDYLTKSQITGDLLVRSIRYAIERRRSEAAVRRSEERLRIAMRASRSGTFMWVPDTGEVEWDEASYELFGLPPGSVTTLEEAMRNIHPDDRAPLARAMAAAPTDDAVHIEFRILQGGQVRWITSTGRVFRPANRPHYIIGALTDITQRKQAMDQLRELNDNLEARIFERTRSLIRYQERLRALTSELTLTEQRERRRLATELHDYLAQLLVVAKMKLNRMPRRDDREVTLLAELDSTLKDCLDYTRTLIAELSPTVLYESGLAAAVAWLGRQMQRHGLTVEVKADANLSPLPEDRLVLVFQTIRELLFNVIKHARVSTAIVTLTQQSREMVVTVRDEGVGFDTTSRDEIGVGGKFGLFSIRERLESLGGRFDITSTLGKGTVATLTISTAAAPGDAPAEDDAADVRPAERSGREITVLLVDDHELVREGLRSVIESSDDLEVIGEAINGEQAVQLARTLNPCAIVMDVNMPVLGGIEATRRIKSERPTTAIIGLSVHDDPQVAKSMRDAGATAFFTKGDSSQDLCDAIRMACSSHAA